MSECFSIKNDTALSLISWTEKYPWLNAGISTRLGGVSQFPYQSLNLGLHVKDRNDLVIKNRQIFGKENDIPIDQWVCAEQTHGNQIKKVTKSYAGKGVFSFQDVVKDVDGLYTDETGVILTAGFADCVPIFFLAPKKHLIGIAHAGWKGTVGNIVKTMVDSWKSEGITPSEIKACIGPSICGSCYQVDNVVIDAVNRVLSNPVVRPYKEVDSGQFLLDLKEVNKQLMIQAGILTENIEITSYCTSCDNNLFFSHRKEKALTGRMMAFITLTD